MNTRLLCCLLALSPSTALADDAHWGYQGEHGAEHWGELDPAFALCSTGRNQSPINIDRALDAELPALQLDYSAASQQIVHNGHTVQINFANGAVLQLDGQPFALKQAHFHAPSENTIEGKSFPLEAHFVHQSSDGQLAVIGLMFELGSDNPGLLAAWQGLPMKAGEQQTMTELPATQLLPSHRDYYRFNGSLTTPPCSEGVRWLLLKQAVSLSAAQLARFTDSIEGHNNRPVQALNARVVVE